MIRKVDTRIDNIERVMASIDYSISKFQEVDEKIASRVKSSQVNEIRNQKSQIAVTNIGVFSSSLINDGSNIWKSLEGNVVQWYDKSKVKVDKVAKTASDATGKALGFIGNKAKSAASYYLGGLDAITLGSLNAGLKKDRKSVV